jgi:putative peptidoglycan lipid II flippase
MENVQKKKLTGAALIVMTSIIVSRITGFFREMLVPNMLGVNQVGDAYNIAFRVTGLMYDLLVGGAIAAALIPILTGYLAKDQEEDGWKAVGTFINIIFIVMAFVCTLGVIFAPKLVPVIAFGFKGEATDLTIKVTRILFPSVAFLMLAGLTNGVLNSYQRFAAAAYGPSIYNIGCALSILFLSKKSVESVAYGVLTSAIIYFLFQFSFSLKNLKYYRFKLYFKHPGLSKLFKLAIPSLISSSIVQINVIIVAAFATGFGSGSVTALTMADRTWQLPYGIFAQGIGIAILPTLSAKLAIGEVNEFKNLLIKALKSVLMLTIPSGIGFIVLREPIIRTLFKFSSKFKEDAVFTAGTILMFFSIALLTQSIVAIMNRGFYANNDTKTPLFVGLSTVMINYALSFIFFKTTTLGVAGMALAYSTTSTLNAVLLLFFLNKKMRGINLDKLLIFLLKVIPASVIMGLILYFVNLIHINLNSKAIQLSFLLIEIIIGIAVFSLIVLLMKVEEAKYILNAVTNKIKKFNNKMEYNTK